MATDISDWRTPLKRKLPKDAGNTELDAAVLETVRDFCKETLIWTERLAMIDIVAVSASDIAFVASSPATITSTSTDFTASGCAFVAGMKIVTDSASNDRELIVGTVAANLITLDTGDHVTAESAGSTIKIGAASYALSTTSGDIVSVDRVERDSEQVPMLSEQTLNETVDSWRTKMSDTPSGYFVGTDKKLRLVYAPSTALAGGLGVWVNLKPTLTATTVEDFIYDDYRRVIENGALAELYGQPNKDWHDFQKAAVFQSMYLAERNKLRRVKHDGIAEGPGSVPMVPFAI